MRPFLIGLTFLTSVGFAFVACSEDPTGSSSSSSSASSTGGAPNCDGIYLVYGDEDGGDPCDICLHEKCCAEIADCNDEACKECANFHGPDCGTNSWVAFNCAVDLCKSTCAPGWPPSTVASSGVGGATSSSSGK